MVYQVVLGTFQSHSPISSAGEEPFEPGFRVDSVDGETDQKPIGWAYVGSHNFSPTAWGMLSGPGYDPILKVSIL